MQTLHTNSRRFTAILLRCIGISLALTFASIAQADPPTRVARLGYVSGAVSFSPAGETTWVAGTLNRPIVTGDRLWADDRGRVELQIGSAMVRLGARTLFTLTNLDDRIAQMNLQDGTLNLRVRRLDRNQVVEVNTPNLAFVIRQEGEYRINVDAARNSTQVRTRSGRAEVFGRDARYTVGLGRAYAFYGAGLTDYDVLTMPRADEFDQWCQVRDRRYETSTSARYVSRDVIGYQDLDQYGSWRSVPQYGNVWTPTRVSANWAPYRDGHWSWVEPWGWTWIDDLPWGFAVSHYGRWINDGGRWGWIPGPVTARAVYAPALVAFIGGSNFQVSGTSGNVAAVGWFPLGPREVYRPAYAVSREYFTNVNISNTVINNTTIINNYDNRNATTVLANAVYVNQSVPGAVVAVPTTTFVQAQPVARAAMRVSEAALMAAPVIAVAAIAPMQSSILGAAPTRSVPPQLAEQRFVAQSQPPAAPVPFAVRERALAANPGKPVEAAVLATLKPQALPPARGTPGSPASPAPVMVAPRVDIVPEARTSGAAVVAPPPRAPSDRRGVTEQRAPQAEAGDGQAQPAPVVGGPGSRPAASATPDAGRPGNRPAEAPGRTVAAPPVPPAPATVAPPPLPTSPGNPGREQRDAPPAPSRGLPPPQPQAAPPVSPATPAARPPTSGAPEASRPGNRASEAPGRTVAVPPIAPGVVTQPPAPPPPRPGNPVREQRETPAPSGAPNAPARVMPSPQQPPVAPAPPVNAAQPPARAPTTAAQDAQRPGNRPSEAPGRPVAAPPAQAAQPSPAAAQPASTRPGNSAREQRDTQPIPPAQVAPPAPTGVPPAVRQPQPPAAEAGGRAPNEPRRGRPEPAAEPQPVPAPPPAAAGRPGEAPPSAAPPKPAKGEKRPNVGEDKKGEKFDEDGNPLPEEKERKRR